jgi:hypothetical protein
MYVQVYANDSHFSQSDALATASAYADTQPSAFALASATAFTRALESPARTQFATTEATAAAYADAVALAASSLEPLPSQMYATASFAAHPTRAHFATVAFSEISKDASRKQSATLEHSGGR